MISWQTHLSYAQGWVWGRKAKGAGVDGYTIAADPFGNIYGGGIRLTLGSLSFGGFTVPSISPQSVWVKYDHLGNTLWADGIVSGRTWLYSMTSDISGNLILFGEFISNTMQIGTFTLTNAYAGAAAQYFLAKINPSGTVLWAVSDGNVANTISLNIMGTEILGPGSVTTDAGGNIYITSAFKKSSMTIGIYALTNSDPTGNTADVFVAKYTPAGAVAWATSIGGNKDDYSFGMAVSSTGNIYIGGAYSSTSIAVGSSAITNSYTKPLAYIAKFSPSGAPVWAEGEGGPNGALATGLAKDNFGNVYMTGGFADGSISFGSSIINRTYPTAVPELALYLVQFSSSDVVTWSKTIGSPTKGLWGLSIALASCGQVWVSGNYDEDALIAPGDTLKRVSGIDPVFIAGYNLSGGIAGYSGLGSGGDDQNGIACDAAGNVYLCSDFVANWPLIVGPDTLIAGSVVGGIGGLVECFYMAKYSNYASPPDTVVGTDTIICINNSGTTLFATSGYDAYSWDNGSTGSTRSVTSEGKYYVYCITCGMNIRVDTFNVFYLDTAHGATDTSGCASVGALTLKAPPNYNYYLWNTGMTSPSIVATIAGMYWVYNVNGCATLIDTFNVTFTPQPIVSLGNDTTLCIGSIITVSSAKIPGYSYLWNTGSTSNSINIATAGTYWLTVNFDNCTAADTISINAFDSPPASFSLGPDTTLCSGDAINLSAQTGTNSILWSNSSNNSEITVTQTGLYWAIISNICGSATDTIQVNFENCDLLFPSAFTPNGDGRNDIIKVFGNLKFFTNFSLSIFNRYGERVFYTEDIEAGWDGKYNGTMQDLGTYFYIIRYSLEGHKHLMKGDFQLIR